MRLDATAGNRANRPRAALENRKPVQSSSMGSRTNGKAGTNAIPYAARRMHAAFIDVKTSVSSVRRDFSRGSLKCIYRNATLHLFFPIYVQETHPLLSRALAASSLSGPFPTVFAPCVRTPSQSVVQPVARHMKVVLMRVYRSVTSDHAHRVAFKLTLHVAVGRRCAMCHARCGKPSSRMPKRQTIAGKFCVTSNAAA